MRNILTILLVSFFLFGFSQNQKGPIAHFPTKFKQFDNLVEGQPLEFEFEFENTGDVDLFIIKVDVTCGCTVPDWPKDPIKPGEKSAIKVTFDTEGRIGLNNKGINLVTNSGEVNLVFYANVLPSLIPKETPESIDE